MICDGKAMGFVADALDELDDVRIMRNCVEAKIAFSWHYDCFMLLGEAEVGDAGGVQDVFDGFELRLATVD